MDSYSNTTLYGVIIGGRRRGCRVGWYGPLSSRERIITKKNNYMMSNRFLTAYHIHSGHDTHSMVCTEDHTLLTYAVSLGQIEHVERIMKSHPRLINTMNPNGRTPLHVACEECNVGDAAEKRMIQVIYDAGGDPYIKTSSDGCWTCSELIAERELPDDVSKEIIDMFYPMLSPPRKKRRPPTLPPAPLRKKAKRLFNTTEGQDEDEVVVQTVEESQDEESQDEESQDEDEVVQTVEESQDEESQDEESQDEDEVVQTVEESQDEESQDEEEVGQAVEESHRDEALKAYFVEQAANSGQTPEYCKKYARHCEVISTSEYSRVYAIHCDSLTDCPIDKLFMMAEWRDMFKDLYRLTDLTDIDVRIIPKICHYLLGSKSDVVENNCLRGGSFYKTYIRPNVDNQRIDERIPTKLHSSKLFRMDGKLYVTMKDGVDLQLIPIIMQICEVTCRVQEAEEEEASVEDAINDIRLEARQREARQRSSDKKGVL